VEPSLLPEIFSLTVFIVGFQPLVRRVGAHANLWFLSWFFLLLHELTVFFTPLGSTNVGVALLATLLLALCGLTFMVAAANSTKAPGLAASGDNRPSTAVGIELALAVLAQTTACTVHFTQQWLAAVIAVLYVSPAVHILVTRERRRPVVLVVGVFAAFGVLSLFFATRFPAAIGSVELCLVFCAAAYLYATSLPRLRRGGWAAILGLVTAGVSYPLQFVLVTVKHWHLQRAIFELPQYLIVAGISLTLLEEHVLRTERMANHDPLTDLPNRRLFEERLIATMEEAREQRTTVACLVIDIDNFKTINDTLGHSAGDQLLRALAVRLSWHMSPRDILARTGGDEFTALLAGVRDEHHLRFIAGAMMSAASVPIIIDSGPIEVRISVGIALSPDHADDIDSLRRLADEAMYSAKRRGGSLLAFAGED
jgi:diguanylate cyclase (GGDEF)-like protein